jgi:serine/threonine protein kinase
MWSLGVILFSMVTGDSPWKHSSMQQLVFEIQTVHYTLPAYVSPDCGDLIANLLRAAPEQRPTAAAVREHPWLGVAKGAAVRALVRPKEGLPTLKGLSMTEISCAAEKSSTQASHGIYSPFAPADQEGSLPLKEVRRPSLPRLCINPTALMSMQKAGEERPVPVVVPPVGSVNPAWRRGSLTTPRTVIPALPAMGNTP